MSITPLSCNKKWYLLKKPPLSTTQMNEYKNRYNEEFGQKKITAKQLTRNVIVELIDKIYVFPEQEIDIHFKFVNPLLEAEEEAK